MSLVCAFSLSEPVSFALDPELFRFLGGFVDDVGLLGASADAREKNADPVIHRNP